MEGKYFEELKIGDEFVTRARTITETDIVYFAGLSWDHNPEHTDAEFAKGSAFKERIAHMLLSLVDECPMLQVAHAYEQATQ